MRHPKQQNSGPDEVGADADCAACESFVCAHEGGECDREGAAEGDGGCEEGAETGNPQCTQTGVCCVSCFKSAIYESIQLRLGPLIGYSRRGFPHFGNFLGLDLRGLIAERIPDICDHRGHFLIR